MLTTKQLFEVIPSIRTRQETILAEFKANFDRAPLEAFNYSQRAITAAAVLAHLKNFEDLLKRDGKQFTPEFIVKSLTDIILTQKMEINDSYASEATSHSIGTAMRYLIRVCSANTPGTALTEVP